MSIIRTHKNTQFTTIDNAGLKDPKLSWQSKGLLAFLLTLPDDWQIYVTELSDHVTNGRDGTASALNELIEAGYVQRLKARSENGTFKGYEYHIFEGGQPNPGKPFTDNPNTVNPTLLNTNSTNIYNKKESINTKEKDGSASQVLDSLLKMVMVKHGRDYKTDGRWIQKTRGAIGKLLNQGVSNERMLAATEWYSQNEFFAAIQSGRDLETHITRIEQEMNKAQKKQVESKDDWSHLL